MADDNISLSMVDSFPEQAFFDLGEDASFLLLPPSELRNRVTGKKLERFELVRELLVMVFVAQWPMDEIHKRTRIHRDTLRAFAASVSEKVGQSAKELQGALRSKGARWIAIASTREHEATFPQLVMASKLLFDAAGQMEQTGLVGEEKVLKEDKQRLEAASRLRALAEQVAAEHGLELGAQADSNLQLSDKAIDMNDLRDCRAVSGAVTVEGDGLTGAVKTAGGSGDHPSKEGAGGGQGVPPHDSEHMGSESREIQPKGSLP